MGVYIKGMEMPRTCYDCKLRRRNGLELICPVLERSYKIADTQILFVREKDFPLIEVPEPHGRLILADELIEFIENRYEITWKDDYEGGIKDACVDILEKISTMPRYSTSESKERPAFLPQYELTPRSEEG